MGGKELENKITLMKEAGLDDNDILRLARVKKRIEIHELDDLTIEHKRMEFLKFLYTRGKLRE